MNTRNKQPTWDPLGRPSGRDHHRYFARADDGRVSVADNSGSNPDYTDDGPLYLDTTRSATIEPGYRGKAAVRLPVRTKNGERARCFVQPGDLVFLIHHNHWSKKKAVTVDDALEPLADLFSMLNR